MKARWGQVKVYQGRSNHGDFWELVGVHVWYPCRELTYPSRGGNHGKSSLDPLDL